MSAYTVARTLVHVRRTIVRSGWALALGLGLAIAALVAYRSTAMSTNIAPAPNRSQVAAVGPAIQNVLDYLQAHSSYQALPAQTAQLDPAQRSVIDYLRAHRVGEPPSAAPWDAALQAMLDYVRVHRR